MCFKTFHLKEQRYKVEKEMNIFKEIINFKTKEDYINFLKRETQIRCAEMDNLSRPEHVSCVYLLGRTLFIKLYGNCLIPTPEGHNISFQDIWKYISIFHDIGYGFQNSNLLDDTYNPNQLRLIYLGYVLDVDSKVNDRWAVAYNIDELLAYYNYLYEKRGNENLSGKKNHFEVHEHGVLGGAIASKIMTDNVPKTMKTRFNTWFYIRLASILAIAQHNIWPVTHKDIKKYSVYFNSSNVDKTKFYKRHYHLDHHIDLLSFYICFIDSMEFVKRMYKPGKELSYRFIKLFLNNFQIRVDLLNKCAKVRIYTRKLERICRNNHKLCIFKKWKAGIKKMPYFLNLNVKEHKNGVVDIFIKGNNFRRI